MRHLLGLSLLGGLISACTGIPDKVTPVSDFELNRYLGKWYEIARLDHSFERNLDNVTAEYSLREDGGVRVINRGYSSDKNEWKQAEGKAYFIENSTIGRLKVSFFGPFYGAYNIMALDRIYRYAMISGPDTSYLWILSRDQELDPRILSQLIDQAKAAGFDISNLIFVKHKYR